MLSSDEWWDMTNKERREALGLHPEEEYMYLFEKMFGIEKTWTNSSYDLYCEWYILTNSPLGKALA